MYAKKKDLDVPTLLGDIYSTISFNKKKHTCRNKHLDKMEHKLTCLLELQGEVETDDNQDEDKDSGDTDQQADDGDVSTGAEEGEGDSEDDENNKEGDKDDNGQDKDAEEGSSDEDMQVVESAGKGMKVKKGTSVAKGGKNTERPQVVGAGKKGKEKKTPIGRLEGKT